VHAPRNVGSSFLLSEDKFGVAFLLDILPLLLPGNLELTDDLLNQRRVQIDEIVN
jgi:hypothetical protein